MLVPGITDVFKIYNCAPYALKECTINTPIPLTFTTIQRISPSTWAISIACAIVVLLVHFLGRLIKLPDEFKVTDARIKKDFIRIKKRQE